MVLLSLGTLGNPLHTMAVETGDLLDQICPARVSGADHILIFMNAFVNFKVIVVKPKRINMYCFSINSISVLKALQ